MHQKLKAVFRSPSKKQARSSQLEEAKSSIPETSPPYTSRRSQPRTSIGDGSSQQTARPSSRSQPLSSVYDSNDMNSATNSNSESIGNNYKSYLPALSSEHASIDHDDMSPGGHKSLVEGGSKGRHEEDVADRNIERNRDSIDASARKPLSTTQGNSSSFGNSPKRYSMGKDLFNDAGPLDSAVSQSEAKTEHKSDPRKSSFPTQTFLDNHHEEQNKMRAEGTESKDGIPSVTAPDSHRSHGDNLAGATTTKELDGQANAKKEVAQHIDSVVDLRNTTDTDKETRYAPAVVHETVKPHEHEIIQHQIFREIHNYEFHHRIQPIHHLEVLQPRHWTMDPHSGKLVEIPAADLPKHSYEQPMWDIVPRALQPSSIAASKYRTEPEIIEHPTTITPEGFERKETTIIHPPTLQDMSDYDGLVQPVHFDHKTGKRWLGQITPMHNLRGELERGQHGDGNGDDGAFAMNGLAEHLPGESDVPPLSPSSSKSGHEIKRKPVHHAERIVNFVD